MNPELNQPGTETNELASALPWDMNNSYWYADKCFSKYWRHYNDARQWYMNHLHYLNAVNSSLCYLPQTASAPLQPRSSLSQTGGWKYRKHKRQKKTVTQRQSCKSVTSSKETGWSSQGEEEFQVEITDAWREFLAKSSELKKKKEMTKTMENNSQHNDQCINIEDLADQPREASHLPPSERPGARRTLQMKQLYGKEAGIIHGMETALQMEFDRIVDMVQPKLWPNMPLKCVFH